MKNNFIKFPFILAIFGVLATLLLATVYQITEPIISARKYEEANAALLALFPNTEISPVDASTYLNYAETILEISTVEDENQPVSTVYKITGIGYGTGGAPFVLLIGIAPDRTINGYAALDVSGETSSIGGVVLNHLSEVILGVSIDQLPSNKVNVFGATAPVTLSGVMDALELVIEHYDAHHGA